MHLRNKMGCWEKRCNREPKEISKNFSGMGTADIKEENIKYFMCFCIAAALRILGLAAVMTVRNLDIVVERHQSKNFP